MSASIFSVQLGLRYNWRISTLKVLHQAICCAQGFSLWELVFVPPFSGLCIWSTGWLCVLFPSIVCFSCFGVFLSFGSRAKGKGGNGGHLMKRCTAEAMTHYVEVTVDWDGVETVTAETGTTLKGRCWDGYFWYPPACRDPWSPHRSQSSTTYPTWQHTACRYHTCW